MKFIGIDFGWKSQPSGLCCLQWTDNQLELLDLDRKEFIADILICAYVAAHWWYWGEQRNLVLGDRTTGYIVIPQKWAKRSQEEKVRS